MVLNLHCKSCMHWIWNYLINQILHLLQFIVFTKNTSNRKLVSKEFEKNYCHKTERLVPETGLKYRNPEQRQ